MSWSGRRRPNEPWSDTIKYRCTKYFRDPACYQCIPIPKEIILLIAKASEDIELPISEEIPKDISVKSIGKLTLTCRIAYAVIHAELQKVHEDAQYAPQDPGVVVNYPNTRVPPLRETYDLSKQKFAIYMWVNYDDSLRFGCDYQRKPTFRPRYCIKFDKVELQLVRECKAAKPSNSYTDYDVWFTDKPRIAHTPGTHDSPSRPGYIYQWGNSELRFYASRNSHQAYGQQVIKAL